MNNGFEGIQHNSIWSDEPEPEPNPPSFESKIDVAHNSLRKKIEELIRAREKRNQQNSDTEDETNKDPTPTP
jgi:hypothetical protein